MFFGPKKKKDEAPAPKKKWEHLDNREEEELSDMI